MTLYSRGYQRDETENTPSVGKFGFLSTVSGTGNGNTEFLLVKQQEIDQNDCSCGSTENENVLELRCVHVTWELP